MQKEGKYELLLNVFFTKVIYWQVRTLNQIPFYQRLPGPGKQRTTIWLKIGWTLFFFNMAYSTFRCYV